MSITLTVERARELARTIFETHGVSAENAAILTELIVAAESAGTRSHGLMRLPDYLASINAGWLVPDARPSLRRTDTPFITADGNNGFTQAAAWLARQPLIAALQTCGFAALSVRNGQPNGALTAGSEEGVGLDRAGRPTTDPAAVLDQGALLPFGDHKGASIALMVEIMAAALTGGRFGYEDDSAAYPGAASSNAGQFILLVDPARTSSGSFSSRIGGLFEHLRQDAARRLPGDRRRERRERAAQHGLTLSLADYESLRRLLPPDAASHRGPR